MIRKSLSAVMAVALAVSMSFSVSEEVLAAGENQSMEDNICGLEVQFVDSLEDLA